MKKLILILYFLLIPTVVFAFGMSVLGSGGGVSYLLSENADGSVECTVPPSGILNCQRVWTWNSPVAILTPNYTPAIEGVYSFLIDSTTTSVTFDGTLSAETSPIYGYFMIKPTTWTGATARVFCILRDADEVNQLRIFKTANSGNLYLMHGTNSTAASATALDTSNVFYLWFDYTKGTGGNGIAHLYINTNATKPASPELTITNGAATGSIGIIRFQSIADETDYILDHIRLDDVNIGSNPQ